MNYYTLLDANDLPVAFYNDDLYPPNADGSRNAAIPSAAISITEAQWSKALAGGVQWSTTALDWTSYTAPVVITSSMIDAERDLRLYGGFTYNGVAYQTDAASIANILGASQIAYMAIVSGSQPGDYSWMSGSASQPFVWLSLSNAQIKMDAPGMVNFAKAAATFRSAIIYSGRALKDALAAGQTVDIYADASWASYSIPTS